MPSDKILYDIVQKNHIELKNIGALNNKSMKIFEQYLEHGKPETVTIFENYDSTVKEISKYINNITNFDADIIEKFVRNIFGDSKPGLNDIDYIEYVKEFCKLFDKEHTLVIETDNTEAEGFTDEYINKICSFIEDKRNCKLSDFNGKGCHSKIYTNSDNTITKINLTNIYGNDNKINKDILNDYYATEADINGILINYILCCLCGTQNLLDIKEIYLVVCKSGNKTYEKIVTVIEKVEYSLDSLFGTSSDKFNQKIYDNILRKIIKITNEIYKKSSLIHCDMKLENILINTKNLDDIEDDKFELYIIDFGLSSINFPVDCDNINGYYDCKISSGADILFYLTWIYKYYNTGNMRKYTQKWLDIMFEYTLCHYKFEYDKIKKNKKIFNDKEIKKLNESKIYDVINNNDNNTYKNMAKIVGTTIPINLWYYISNNNESSIRTNVFNCKCKND